MQQLSGLDTSFLAMESPTTVGHVTGVLLLDTSTAPEPFTLERFTRHILSRTADIQVFTHKLVEVPFGLDRPYWIPDADFDLDYHLRHVAVPGDGGRDDFSALVSRIHARPLDRRRPLWETYIVDGVLGRYTGLITKLHHAAIDGLSGQEILSALVDLTPDVPVPDTVPERVIVAATDTSQVVRKAALSLLGSPVRMARATGTLARAATVFAPQLLGDDKPPADDDSSSGGSSIRDRLANLGAPTTPFNATIGPHRRWAYVSVPLADVKAIKDATNTKVNDVVLTLVSSVLRDWLADHGGIPERPLAAMVPLSVRTEEQAHATGNFVSSTVCTLATDIENSAERLIEIHAAMNQSKEQQDALPANILTDLTQVFPPAVAALSARLVASTRLADRVNLPFNLVVSNVPGPPIPLFLAGAKIIAHYPVSAIVDGVGLNVTVSSIDGHLDFGFVSDRDLVPDLWDMADAVPGALAELAASVEAMQTKPPAATKKAKTKKSKKKPAKA
ncbi:MAG: wax ester/triacylglycerol synthase family O-acyltransferase [Acidimicrobiales bacterium]|nr:wax ester/triacylglycerol synthase family O-acyltransferase [Acidimicrobiales bacterium]